MKFKVKYSFLLFSIAYWTVTSNIYTIIRFAGNFSDQGQPILTSELMLQVTLPCMVIGAILSLINVNFKTKKIKESFARTILFNTAGYLLFFLVIIFITSLFGNSLEFAKEFFFSTESLVTILFLAVNSLIYHFILQMNRMFGPGVLMEIISGKYFNPVEEERIFMFLDLRSSTSIAEKLGHEKYSKLIQDCYAIVGNPAAMFKASIYQYVGDEVVVTWKFSQTSMQANCIHFYFEFQNLLNSKREYFLQKFGVVPEFKAGIHFGKVMAAEVGTLKSEIAYHGDVLNAASRIQGMCNEFNESLLVSEKLLAEVELPPNYISNYLGNLTLKGKNEKLKIHSINLR